jgi:hypothetical protein
MSEKYTDTDRIYLIKYLNQLFKDNSKIFSDIFSEKFSDDYFEKISEIYSEDFSDHILNKLNSFFNNKEFTMSYANGYSYVFKDIYVKKSTQYDQSFAYDVQYTSIHLSTSHSRTHEQFLNLSIMSSFNVVSMTYTTKFKLNLL